MNIRKKTGCLLITLLMAAGVAQAESVDVRVTGNITPSGCLFEMPGGSAVNVGNINPQSLKADSLNWLQATSLNYTIRCAGPTKLALSFTNARGASAVNGDGSLSEVATVPRRFDTKSNAYAFGLGMQGSKGIGGYTLEASYALVDGDDNLMIPRAIIWSDGNTTNWKSAGFASLMTPGVKRYFSWTDGKDKPVTFTLLNGFLNVDVYVNKTSELDMSKPITLDGMATLEMVYL